MNCSKCKQLASPLYICGNGELCFNCVPQEVWALYPGSYEKEAAYRKKQELARKNFGHGAKNERALFDNQ